MSDTSPRLGLPAPADTDPADVPVDMDKLRDVLDPIAVIFRQGLASAMPAAGIPGRLYFATDVMALFYDDGAAWHSSLGAATGDIKPSGAGAVPPGWLLCDGAQYPRTDYAILFNVIGLAFSATDDGATFRVPDLRGRTPVGAGQGAGLTNRARGQAGGEENHALSVGEIPSHNHGGATGAGNTGTDSPDHAHGGTTNANDRSLDHLHASAGYGAFIGADGSFSLASFAPQAGHTPSMIANSAGRLATTAAADRSLDHLHSFGTGGATARHAHSVPALAIAAQGGGGGHNNMPPHLAVSWFIKT